MKLNLATAAAACGLMLAGGCSAFRISPPTPATTSAKFNAVWDASLEILRHHHFRIDRADRRSGVITTEPLLGRHWFEFWRADARTRRDLAEGSLQTVYRKATVKVRPASGSPADDPAYAAEVSVATSRSDLPVVRVTSTSEAYELFTTHTEMAASRTTALPEKDSLRAPSGRPQPLGQDKPLAEMLRREIGDRAARKLGLARGQ